MFRAALKSVLSHKVRLALTALAVVLGVGFVTGTYLLTDTLNSSFTNLFGNVYAKVDVAVRGVAHVSGGNAGQTQRDPVPAAMVRRLEQVPGVSFAEGTVGGYAQLVDPATHKAIQNGGAPALGTSWESGSPLSTSTLVSGHAPHGPGEVVVDRHTVDAHHWSVGQQLQVVTRDGVHPVTLTGVFQLAGSDSLGGATVTGFDPATAQQLIGVPGGYDDIELKASPGVTAETLRARIAGTLPAGYEAVTGATLAHESASAVQQGIGFLNTLLLVFAAIALFVGTFIIVNTFSMLVAQRTRELALLRALGASRRQVTRSVLVEAFVTGVVAATIGLGFGFLVALGLQAVLGTLIGLPSASLVFQPRTAIAGYLVGVLVTMVAAYFPARRAARIPPVAAMREDATMPERSLTFRATVGGTLTALGAAVLALGLAGVGKAAVLIGIGAGAVFIGVAVLSPFVSRPVIRTVGAPLPGVFGVPGKLGRENALRSPRRTSSTASALMIGVALVAAMGTLGSSLVASTNKIIDKSLGADIVITSSGAAPGLPSSVAQRTQGISGVQQVTRVQGGMVDIAGKNAFLLGVSAGGSDALGLQTVHGSLGSIHSGRLAVQQDVADAHHWTVGQQVPVVFGKTGTKQLTIGATYAKTGIGSGFLVSLPTLDANFDRLLDQIVLVSLRQGADVAAVKGQIDKAVADVPTAQVQDQAEFKAQQRKQIENVVNFIYGLLALSIIIAILGIVNTLALSVFERTREIGLLRAVGLGRRQLRRTIRLESVLIAVFGAVIGIALGLVFGWAMQQALESQGVTELAFPWGTIVGTLVAAALVGVLAATWPAFRASRMNVLRAIASE